MENSSCMNLMRRMGLTTEEMKRMILNLQNSIMRHGIHFPNEMLLRLLLMLLLIEVELMIEIEELKERNSDSR